MKLNLLISFQINVQCTQRLNRTVVLGSIPLIYYRTSETSFFRLFNRNIERYVFILFLRNPKVISTKKCRGLLLKKTDKYSYKKIIDHQKKTCEDLVPNPLIILCSRRKTIFTFSLNSSSLVVVISHRSQSWRSCYENCFDSVSALEDFTSGSSQVPRFLCNCYCCEFLVPRPFVTSDIELKIRSCEFRVSTQ